MVKVAIKLLIYTPKKNDTSEESSTMKLVFKLSQMNSFSLKSKS